MFKLRCSFYPMLPFLVKYVREKDIQQRRFSHVRLSRVIDPKAKKLLLGLGLDAKDDHKRVTTGKNLFLAGGSRETHECMQEKAIKLNEELDKRGKSIDEVREQEFREIAERLDMNVPSPEQQKE